MGKKTAESEAERMIDEMIDEWMGLFRRYRNDGELPTSDRQRFRALSDHLRKLGLLDGERPVRTR